MARFERLFDGWENDTDITMVDLGNEETVYRHDDLSPSLTSNVQGSTSPRSPSVNDSLLSPSSNRHTSIASTIQPYDDRSTRSLLRKNSATTATTTDFSPGLSGGGTRSRYGDFQKGSTAIQKLFRRKSVISQRTTSTFDGNFAHGRPGWWKKQMLVDRSLRSMTFFTSMCALIMFVIIFSYLGDFIHRVNKNTTSVGGKTGVSCGTMETRNVFVHLAINIAATMILGCSNTYQQLVTSLKVGEIRWVLENRGDSRVGTNSPWAINHKKEGKARSWAAWLLLISTSVPVHFLANSVIGPSFYIQMPTDVLYEAMDVATQNKAFSDQAPYYYDDGISADDGGCWTAFRANTYVLPQKTAQLSSTYHISSLGNSTTYKSVKVTYNSNCTSYVNNTDAKTALNEHVVNPNYYRDIIYQAGDCVLAKDVSCSLSDAQPKQCRENVRMQAAFILGGCLLVKALYMITQNYLARFRTKDHCLTYGDVIVASVLDPEVKIKNECLLNSGDGYRHQVTHTCHKHCKDPVPSTTGDIIGHCQKCTKYNVTNKAANLEHPSIAIKYKRSLLSNLGSTAITQMLILMFTSLAMLGISIMLIVLMKVTTIEWHRTCDNPEPTNTACSVSLEQHLKNSYGTWGGFSSSATLSMLPPDSLSSEFMAFAISNGAQFLYSLLYLLLIYNLTLISMEHEWGQWEMKKRRPRCTIVSGRCFEQSYFLQLPSRLLIPLMVYASLMHWLLGQAVSTAETTYSDLKHGVEHSIYFVTYAAYPIFFSTILMVAMTVVCWWAFTYTREGFIPQMYGSIRTCCASTTELVPDDFGEPGLIWGDLGLGEKWRHAGFSAHEPGEIVPAALYCG